jgi:hypothetical protein
VPGSQGDVGIVLSGGGVNAALLELGLLERLRESELWPRIDPTFRAEDTQSQTRTNRAVYHLTDEASHAAPSSKGSFGTESGQAVGPRAEGCR